MPEFLRSRSARILTLVLVVQSAVFYGFSRQEATPSIAPLSTFPTTVGDWSLYQEGVIEKEILDVLRADDILSRTYYSSSGLANLFIAFFKSQRAGQAPHSPKNCLPGSGWVPELSGIVSISVPGSDQSIEVNRYIVQKGDERSLVLYWYQSRNRVVANEYVAKFYVVADAIRYNRTDTALVRVVIPFTGSDHGPALRLGEQFVQAVFPLLKAALPG
jgi:EpsI family protein